MIERNRHSGNSSPITHHSSLIELVLVKVAHQPFGLLMSQVYNIVRPEDRGVKLLKHPTSGEGREWGEIEYRGQTLKVLELARMLHLSLVEPLERSQILLGGKLSAGGAIIEPFGVACDDIIVITTVNSEDLRTVPGWLFYKRLGKLVWGAALLERELLVTQDEVEGIPGDLLVGAPVRGDELSILGQPVTFTTPHLNPAPSSGRLMREAKPKDERRPVMLLDLDVLRRRIYTL